MRLGPHFQKSERSRLRERTNQLTPRFDWLLIPDQVFETVQDADIKNLRAQCERSFVYYDPMKASASPSAQDQPRDDEGVDFGRYRIFPRLRLLLRDGLKVDLGTRAFDVLWVLVQASGELVSKDQLIETVWSGVVVEENNLQAQMSAIRRALGPDRGMVRTEFGLGYRLAADRYDAAGSNAERSHNGRSHLPSLPLPLTSLLGRATDLHEIERMYDKSRLVTISGAGGVGKTRVALELGRRMAPQFQNGVCLAEMAKISEDKLVGPTLAGALQIPSSDIDRADRIETTLSGHHLLLIVDNCEHIAGPIAHTVEMILRHGPSVKVLITSQEPLGIEGEQVYRLAPLAVPPVGTRDLDTAMAYPAFELFAERSAANAQALELDVEAASTICQRLDGLPLALELAGARVATLGVQGVLAGLVDRFNLLTAGRRTALSRHRTLRATVDWSYHLLSADEQRLLRRLALFGSSFDSQAARAVAAPESDDPWFCLDLLGSLVGKSLLLLDLGRPAPRYRFLESIRFYALEKLAQSGDVETTAERHAHYFLDIGRRASDDWKTLPTHEWRATYADAIDDLRAALDWSFSTKGDLRTGISMLASTTPFWIQLSLHDECRRRITQALDHRTSTLDPEDEMMLSAALGTALSWAIGPALETGAAWHKALEFARKLDASEIELQGRYGLWLYNLRSGHYDTALEHAEELLQLSSKLHDLEARAVGQRISGVAQHFLGNHDRARELIENSLRWFDVNRPQQAFRFGLDQRVAGLAFLSRLIWVQGFADEAKQMARAAVVEARELDHANTICCALAEGWCTVHALDGDIDAVRGELAGLQHIAREHGLGFWSTYGDLFALWAQMRSDGHVSTARLAAAMAAIERLKFDPEYSVLFSDIVLAAHREMLDLSTLPSISARFLTRHDETVSWGEPEFQRVAAHLESSQDATLARLRVALGVSRRQKAKAWTMRITIDLAAILADRGEQDEARAALAAVLEYPPIPNAPMDLAAATLIAARLGLTFPTDQA
ncbi:putative ATPase/DNA-binding winged helix-turn-helix (wHTH) protein [Bradyrhizobium elkanii]